MDIQFIREMIHEQVRLNVALCEAQHALKDKDRELADLQQRNVELVEAHRILKERDSELEELRQRNEELARECEEWKSRCEQKKSRQKPKVAPQELNRVQEEVKEDAVLPYDILNMEEDDENEDPVEQVEQAEERVVVVDDATIKRRVYMREYMKNKRAEKKTNVVKD